MIVAEELLIPDPVERVRRDISDAAKLLSDAEARNLVDSYYAIQDFRKSAGNQVRALSESGEPNAFTGWTFDTMEYIETQIKRALDKYSQEHVAGVWARSISGIGPVISAGLLARIDIHKAPTVGHIWRYAGLDPTVTWEKGQKRPWNASLKVLCWHAGESFVKVQNNEKDIYGKVYAVRKAQEIAHNEAGDFAEQAALVLTRKRIGHETQAYAAYSQGKLPDAHIHARAKRYAVKLFLSGFHEALYFVEYGKLPPMPYVITHLGHAHYIAPPNMHIIDGWEAARVASGVTPLNW